MFQYPIAVFSTNAPFPLTPEPLSESGGEIGGSWGPFTVNGGLPPGAVITGIGVSAKFEQSSGGPNRITSYSYTLGKGVDTYTQSSGDGSDALPVTEGLGGAGDLWTTTWTPSDFNSGAVSVSIGWTGTKIPDGFVTVTAISVMVYYALEGGEDMDFYRAGEQGAWKVLFEEALPSLASSAAMFPSTQSLATYRASVEGCRMIRVTVRGAGITYRGDGNAATASGNGVDLPVGGPYDFSVNDSEAASFNAIQQGSSATGWIQYWGLA